MKQLAIDTSTIESQSLAGAPTLVADGWHDIEWHKITRNVKRLQTRIASDADIGGYSGKEMGQSESIATPLGPLV